MTCRGINRSSTVPSPDERALLRSSKELPGQGRVERRPAGARRCVRALARRASGAARAMGLALLPAIALLAAFVARDAAAADRAVTIKGSDTMVILAQRWIEEYRRSH